MPAPRCPYPPGYTVWKVQVRLPTGELSPLKVIAKTHHEAVHAGLERLITWIEAHPDAWLQSCEDTLEPLPLPVREVPCVF